MAHLLSTKWKVHCRFYWGNIRFNKSCVWVSLMVVHESTSLHLSTALIRVCPFVCRSSDDQEVLFDQILMGQLEFPLPYWDNVSETAKVNAYICANVICLHVLWMDPRAGGKSLTTHVCLLLKELIRSMLEVEVDQRYTALQVLEHPWVTVSTALIEPSHLKSCCIFPRSTDFTSLSSLALYRMRDYVRMITSCQ